MGAGPLVGRAGAIPPWRARAARKYPSARSNPESERGKERSCGFPVGPGIADARCRACALLTPLVRLPSHHCLCRQRTADKRHPAGRLDLSPERLGRTTVSVKNSGSGCWAIYRKGLKKAHRSCLRAGRPQGPGQGKGLFCETRATGRVS